MSDSCDHKENHFIGRTFVRGVWYKIFICENPDCKMELPKVDDSSDEE